MPSKHLTSNNYDFEPGGNYLILDLKEIYDLNLNNINKTLASNLTNYDEFGSLILYEQIYFSISQSDDDILNLDKQSNMQNKTMYNISITECEDIVNCSPKSAGVFKKILMKDAPDQPNSELYNENGIYILLIIFMLVGLVILLILNVCKWRVMRLMKEVKD